MTNEPVETQNGGAMLRDPRHFQIIALSALLAFGWMTGAFEIAWTQIVATFGAAIIVQALGAYMIATRIDLRSPIITALSLSLLLRADAAWPLACAAAIAVGSKFTMRFGDKHVFNPANIGIVAMVLATDAAWTTPGQWGTAVWFAALVAGAGFFVSYRAARIDVPLVFLGVFAALIFARAIWLGDPLTIPLLRLQNGALILFAFFMISDPKTTPDGAIARAVFAASAAICAYILMFHFYMADGLFFALAALTLIRPLMELADPAPHYRWGDPVPQLWQNLKFKRYIAGSKQKNHTAPTHAQPAE